MKLLKQAQLMELPSGTLYARMEQEWVFDEVAIKGDNCGERDFWMTPLGTIEQGAPLTDEGPTSFVERLEEMREKGVSYPMDTTCQREGLYDADALYLVYEPSDIQTLISVLTEGPEELKPPDPEILRDLAHWRYRVSALEREVHWNQQMIEQCAGVVQKLSAEPGDNPEADRMTLANYNQQVEQFAAAATLNVFLLEEARWKVETLMVALLGDRYGA